MKSPMLLGYNRMSLKQDLASNQNTLHRECSDNHFLLLNFSKIHFQLLNSNPSYALASDSTEYIEDDDKTFKTYISRNYLLILVLILTAALILIFFVLLIERNRHKQLKEKHSLLKKENKNLTYLNERMNIAIDSGDLILWEYDIAKKRIIQNKSSKDFHGLESVIKNVPESLVDNGYVHQESVEEYLDMYEKLHEGEKELEKILKVQSPNRQNYRYLKIKYKNLFDDEGNPYKAIGTSEDVSDLYEMKVAHSYWQNIIESFMQNSILHLQYNLTKNMMITCLSEGSECNFPDKSIFDDFDKATNYFVNYFVAEEDRARYLSYVNRERLIKAFSNKKTAEKLEFRMLIDEHPLWVVAIIYLIEEPYTKDIMLYIFFYNIDKEKTAFLQAENYASKDDLTGLLNRRNFIAQVNSLLELYPDKKHAFLIVDIDCFKQVNDTMGHPLGDSLLIEMAGDLRSLQREDDLICRLGGDEFMLCLKNIPSVDVAIKRADAIISRFRKKITDDLFSSASVGIALYPKDGSSFEEIYKKADFALYEAKKSGRDSSYVYKEE
ncbi:MAG: diguanylate cyclase domain-containing protein [Synergistaceae bacterium]